MSLNRHLLCWFLAPLFSSSVFAANTAQEYKCPEAIDVNETVTSVNTPWELSLPQKPRSYSLSKVRFYIGPPNERRNLPVTNESQTKKRRISIWQFSTKERYWVTCSYENTSLLVTRELPEGVSICEVIENLSSTGSVTTGITNIACQ